MIGTIAKFISAPLVKYALIGGAAAFIMWLGYDYASTKLNNGLLEAQAASLTAANNNLVKNHEKRVAVLSAALKREKQRESDYAQNIQIITTGPDGDCSLNSPAINNSLRMRWERRGGFQRDTE